MLIRLIEENAEDLFLKSLQLKKQKTESLPILFCRFSVLTKHIKPDIMILAVGDILKEQHAAMYFCRDGDIAITWQGSFAQTRSQMISALMRRLGPAVQKETENSLFQSYEPEADRSALVSLFRTKIAENENFDKIENKTQEEALPPLKRTEISFSEEQLYDLNKAIKERNSKRGLEAFGTNILIVEDQDFSRKLLHDLLARQFVYTCFAAKDGQEAVSLYAAHAPDIVFLDIELPDFCGHDIAALIKKHDPKSFVTMVTANNFTRDVEIAKKNKVQGFIAKPYSKQKIQEAINAYVRLAR